MRSTNTLLADQLLLLSMGPGVAPAGLGGLAHSATEFLLRGKSPGAMSITYSFFTRACFLAVIQNLVPSGIAVPLLESLKGKTT
jgi:hypothetical protein